MLKEKAQNEGFEGRIVLRKLLLRGYRVRAFVRDEKMAQEVIPSSVEVVIGDITDRSACSQAMIGIDKVKPLLQNAKDRI